MRPNQTAERHWPHVLTLALTWPWLFFQHHGFALSRLPPAPVRLWRSTALADEPVSLFVGFPFIFFFDSSEHSPFAFLQGSGEWRDSQPHTTYSSEVSVHARDRCVSVCVSAYMLELKARNVVFWPQRLPKRGWTNIMSKILADIYIYMKFNFYSDHFLAQGRAMPQKKGKILW
jgi:hypothetical protein